MWPWQRAAWKPSGATRKAFNQPPPGGECVFNVGLLLEEKTAAPPRCFDSLVAALATMNPAEQRQLAYSLPIMYTRVVGN